MGNHFKRPSKTDIHIRAPQVDSSQLYMIFLSLFLTLSPNINKHVLLTILRKCLMVLLERIHIYKHPDILFLVIISFILRACMFEQVVIL